MTAEQLFNLIQQTIQDAVNQEQNQHVYVEREMRGTYPSLVIRVLNSERNRKPKPGAIIISSAAAQPAPETPESDPEPWVAPKEVPIPPEAAIPAEAVTGTVK